MKVTLIHPTIGKHEGQKNYIRTWQMEPLGAATLASLTPSEHQVKFFDDRVETIDYNEPTDLVAISVETYTAIRAYQIASEYRKRNVPVVMGGFHASLCPEEVSQYAESVVVGEAEASWGQVLLDAEKGTLKTYYHSKERPSLDHVMPDRSIFQGKNYVPVSLVEASRGCEFQCEFCAIQTVFKNSQTRRPYQNVLDELSRIGNRRLIFFVDDNITSNVKVAKEFLRALIPYNYKWVSQMSINAAHDEEFLDLLQRSGCQGVLIGFESLNPENLKKMNKGFNMMGGGYEKALANLRKYNIRLYITFVFGYDEDTPDSFSESVEFAKEHNFYITAFNHLTPFPGTPLYKRLEKENRLLYDQWWLDPTYSYNKIPFQPRHFQPHELEAGCVQARTDFYTWRSIWNRGLDSVNKKSAWMWMQYYLINYGIKREISSRDHLPLGDSNWKGELIKVRQAPDRYLKPINHGL